MPFVCHLILYACLLAVLPPVCCVAVLVVNAEGFHARVIKFLLFDPSARVSEAWRKRIKFVYELSCPLFLCCRSLQAGGGLPLSLADEYREPVDPLAACAPDTADVVAVGRDESVPV